MSQKRRWTETEKKQLQEFYPNIGTRQLRELFADRSAMSIYKAANQMGLGKSHERLQEQGRENVSLRKDRQGPFKDPPQIRS